MITPKLYETLDAGERRLWHSHVFEVKSGMLIMPQPSPLVPQAAWEAAETAEMRDVVELYGKVYHLWQVDKGHKIPLGEPKLMTSFSELNFHHFGEEGRGWTPPPGVVCRRYNARGLTIIAAASEQMPDFEEIVGERDARFGSDWKRKKEIREGIKEPNIHPDADATWK